MSHVFISYSHEDKDFVAKLIEYCQIANIDVWLDKADLKAGEYWSPQIDEAITNAFGIILIISPSSSVSPYVTYEWAFAKGLGKKIIPVLCKTVNIDTQLGTEIDTIKQKYGVKLPKPQTHPDFILSHHIDLSNQNNTPQNWRELINQIQGVLDNFLLTNLSPKAPDVVKNAYKNFFSPNETERKSAVLSLSLIEISYAEDALILGLDCDYPDVRFWSAEQLGKKHSIKAIPALIKCVSDKNDEVRLHAVEALIEIGDESIAPGLILALEDKNIKGIALKGLRNIKDIKMIPELIKLLNDSDETIQHESTRILEDFGEDALPNLLSDFQDKDNSDRIRQSIARILGIIGNSKSIPTLIGCIHDDNLLLRRRIITALGEIGHPDAVVTLIECLQDDEDSIRRESALALGKIKSKDAVPSLIMALNDDSYHVRENATRALGEIGSSDALSSLIKVLENDKETSVQECAIRALVKIDSIGAIPHLIKILEGTNEDMKMITPQILADIGEEVIPYLKEARQSSNSDGVIIGVANAVQIMRNQKAQLPHHKIINRGS